MIHRWLITTTLLKEGIPWNDIKDLSDSDILIIYSLILEINSARQDMAAAMQV